MVSWSKVGFLDVIQLTSNESNKLLHADSIQLSRFLLKEKAAKTAPTYSPVNEALYDRSISMYLEFHAREVYYAEGLGGDVINVSFQEQPDPEIDYSKKNFELPPSVKGIFFSVNYEFPPSQIHVDWCDGEEEDGGELIKNNYSFNVSFETDEATFQNIKSLLTG